MPHGRGAAGDDRAGRARSCAIATSDGIKVVPRGAGTSLSGGALPLGRRRPARHGASSTASSRSTTTTAVAVVAAGRHQPRHHRRGRARGFYYAPDPSSQIACSIGGNVAENSGGVHCLKYGLTTNNVLGVEMVLMTGEVVRLGGKHLDAEGYDLLGVVTGSEGLLGVVTEVTVRILRKPETARALLIGFPTAEDAGDCVADIIAAGIIPGGMEMMDQPGDPRGRGLRPCRLSARRRGAADRRARRAAGRGRSPDRAGRRRSRAAAGATTLHACPSRGRSGSPSGPGARRRFPAVGRISPDYYCMDGTIPRAAACRRCCARMREMSRALRPARRQRLPRRRRQPASADPLRRQQAGRARARRGVRRRHPAAVRRGRRRADRRARRRRREARPDAGRCSPRSISPSSSG